MRVMPLRTAIKTAYWIVAALVVLGGIGVVMTLNRIHKYDEMIIRISREYAMDPRLVSAVIWRESKFNASAVGSVGEVGLMQVTEVVGQTWAKEHQIAEFSKHDLFNPEINIRAGTWYLAQALRAWADRPDPLPYALAQYNAGRSNALRWAADDGNNHRIFVENITYPGTREYIEDILKRYRGGV